MELLNSKQIKKLTALDGVRMYGSAFGFEGVRHRGIAFNLYRFIGSPKYDNEYKMIKINQTFYDVSPTRFQRIEEGRFHLDITQPLTLEIVDEAMAKLFIPREIKVYCLRRIYRTWDFFEWGQYKGLGDYIHRVPKQQAKQIARGFK